MLIQSDKLSDICRNATIFLDTNVFIASFQNEELLTLIRDFTKNNDCAFTTISSVEYEFTRGSRSLQELNDRRMFIQDIVHSIFPVGKFLESKKHDAFSVVMSLVLSKKDSQYTDYLLATALYSYKHTEKLYVLSADIKAFPESVFRVVGVITLSLPKKEIIHLHLVEFDKTRYGNIIQQRVAK